MPAKPVPASPKQLQQAPIAPGAEASGAGASKDDTAPKQTLQLPSAVMPPSAAASVPLSAFVANFCPQVLDFLKEQQFTDWSQIAFCLPSTKDREAVDEFARLAKTEPCTRACGECRLLFTKACYIE